MAYRRSPGIQALISWRAERESQWHRHTREESFEQGIPAASFEVSKTTHASMRGLKKPGREVHVLEPTKGHRTGDNRRVFEDTCGNLIQSETMQK